MNIERSEEEGVQSNPGEEEAAQGMLPREAVSSNSWPMMTKRICLR